jgi:hypothetical protein
MSTGSGNPTLDQLRVFLTVVDVGGFAAAARKLGRATSVISYSIANLEAQLGLSLFDRESTRKPQLTGAGRTVLSEARTVCNGIDSLRAKVKGLRQGLEAEIRLALDVMLPAVRVADALKAFRTEFPTVTLRLYVEALGGVTQRCSTARPRLGSVGRSTWKSTGWIASASDLSNLCPSRRRTIHWRWRAGMNLERDATISNSY